MICADGGEGGDAAGIISGAGRDHSRAENGKITEDLPAARDGVAQTSTATPQQASSGGPYRCS